MKPRRTLRASISVMAEQGHNPAALAIRTEHLDAGAEAWLAERCEVLHIGVDDDRFPKAAKDAQALIVRTYTTVDERLLERMPRLRVVGRAGVGLDNIDVEACRNRGVEVVHTPDANTQAVVEYVIAILCDAVRPRLTLGEPVDRARWNEIREEICGAWQMNELILGILGCGRIGRRVAQVAKAIGCTVIYHDLLEIPPEARHGASPVDFSRLLEESDVLTVHVDGRDANHGLIDAGILDRVKNDLILINTSRGFVIDEAALAGWLVRNPTAMAILDVHAQEPFTAEDPLLGLGNVHLAPHLASRTATAMANMSWVVKDVWRVLEDEPPRHPAP